MNGAGFSVYLISSLKGDISACKVTNADGSVSYNFKSYDFSNETGEVVTDDGKRVLVTGSGDNDDGEVTSTDLMPGTYVIVETQTPEGYETVDPIINFTSLVRVCYVFCVDKILIYQYKVLFRLL